MRLKLLDKKENGKRGRFLLEDSSYTFANALRRAIISDLPTMAIDKLIIYENSSSLYDEIFGRRLGLLPLTTDEKTYSFKKYCKCGGEGCARCQVTLILEKSGPGMVYSKDIRSRDPKIKPVYGEMPIVKLAAGQRVRMELIACMGTAKENAKYQRAIASYRQRKDGSFEFMIESYDDRTFDDVAREAAEVLSKKADDFIDAFEEAKKPKKPKESKAALLKVKMAEKTKESEKAKKEEEKSSAKKEKEAEKTAAKTEKDEAKERKRSPSKKTKKEEKEN